MTTIGSVDTSATQAAQAALASTATTTTANQSQAAIAGLPPVSLAAAASLNTLNAELATSQWGVDPASVGGVYGGSAATGGMFAGIDLLPVLTNLTHADAEQALSLLGVSTPTPSATATGSTGATSSTGSTGSTGATTLSASAAGAQSQSALAQAAYGSGTPMVVDPLWGRSA